VISAFRRVLGFSHASTNPSARSITAPRPIPPPRHPPYPIGYGGDSGFYPAFDFDFFDDFNWFGPWLPGIYTSNSQAPPVMLLYLNDGSAAEANDYWIQGDTLHYVSENGRESQIRVSDLDIQRTTDANARVGFRFTLDRTRRGMPLDRDPIKALDVSLSDVVQHPDSRTADFTVHVKSKNLTFLPTDDGKDAAKLTLTAISLDRYRTILVSRADTMTLQSSTGDPILLPDGAWLIRVTIQVPSETKSVRVVMEGQDGPIGTADLDRETIDAAPETVTPISQ
jgi:hypothetical protein